MTAHLADLVARHQPLVWTLGGLLVLSWMPAQSSSSVLAQLLVLAAAPLVVGLQARRRHARRRWFLALLSAVLCSRAAEQIGQLAGIDAAQGLAPSLLTTVLAMAFLVAGAGAAQLIPRNGGLPRSDRVIDLVATGVVGLSAAIYLVAVPSLQLPRQFDPWPAPRVLYLALDLLLLAHAIVASRAATTARWRAISGHLPMVALLWLLPDGAACTAYLLPEKPVLLWIQLHGSVLSLAPFLWAIGLPWRASTGLPARSASEPVGGWLLLYTAALPAAHIGLYSVGWLNPATRATRDVVVLLFVLVMGSLGLLREVFFESRRRKIEEQRRRAEHLSLLLRSALEIMPLGLEIRSAGGDLLYRNRTLGDWLAPAAHAYDSPTDPNLPRTTELVGSPARRSGEEPPGEAPTVAGLPPLKQLTVPTSGGGARPLLQLSERVPDPSGRGAIEVSVFEDLTEAAELESRLRAAEQRYRRLTDALPVAILVLDSVDHVLFANPAAQSLFALDSPTGHQVRSPLKQLLDRLSHRGALGTHSLTMDEPPLELLVTVDEVQFEHRAARRLVVRDVSRVMELRRRGREVADLAAVGQMSATLAHEIRNPLAAIKLNLELLEASGRAASLPAGGLRRLQEAVRQLQQVADGVLELTRTTSLQTASLDLAEVTRSCFLGTPSTIEERPAGSPVTLVRVDVQQLARVARSLVDNAIEAADGTPVVRVATEVDAGWASILVSDRGHGVPPSLRDRIFEPFFTTREGHAGLGLTLAAAILRRHGGRLQLEPSTEESGETCFRLCLPRQPPTVTRFGVSHPTR